MTKAENQKPKRRVLAPTLRKQLAQLATKQGTVAAAKLLGVHPQTLAAVLAGLPGHRSTVALVERRLVELAEQEPGSAGSLTTEDDER
jgi:hypothetical protein